jgi:hypothetical protein
MSPNELLQPGEYFALSPAAVFLIQVGQRPIEQHIEPETVEQYSGSHAGADVSGSSSKSFNS